MTRYEGKRRWPSTPTGSWRRTPRPSAVSSTSHRPAGDLFDPNPLTGAAPAEAACAAGAQARERATV